VGSDARKAHGHQEALTAATEAKELISRSPQDDRLKRAKVHMLPALGPDRFLAAAPALVNKPEFDQCGDDPLVGFIQDTHDVANGKVMICKEIANGCLAFQGRIQPGSVGGHDERLGS
jgi:hypothetical protein